MGNVSIDNSSRVLCKGEHEEMGKVMIIRFLFLNGRYNSIFACI